MLFPSGTQTKNLESKYLSFIESKWDCNVLYKLNLETLEEEQIQLSIQGHIAEIYACSLPHQETFCYANLKISEGCQGYRTVGLTIILKENNEIQMFESDPGHCPYAACYLDGAVYGFGTFYMGYSDILTRRFIIARNKWEIIPAPLIYSCRCVCIEFQGMILIAGYMSSAALIYDPFANSYSELPIDLDKNSQKVIFKFNERAYLIESKGFLYESDIRSNFIWNVIDRKSIKINWSDSFQQVMYKGKLYYLMGHEVYEFNLDENRQVLIKKVK